MRKDSSLRRFKINPEYLESLNRHFSEVDEDGEVKYATLSTTDHPAFADLRDHLERKGLIETWRQVSNGDTVLEDFMLNGHIFRKGDRFPSAGAMGFKFRVAEKMRKEPLEDNLFEVK